MIRTMILGNGTGNYAYPAWQYLLKSSLYDNTTNMFKPFSDSAVGTPVANKHGDRDNVVKRNCSTNSNFSYTSI